MKSRILVSMLVIALSAALVGGATMAIFSAEAETNERTYAAGTVEITAGNQTFHEIDTLGNMAPGDTIEGEFKVKNTGSLPLWFEVTEETKKVEGSENNYLFGGPTPAEVTIEEYENDLDRGEERTIFFSVHLPLDAGNWYQNAEGILLFNVYAEQSDHNPYEGGNGGDDPGDPEGDDEVDEFQVNSFNVVGEHWTSDTVSFNIVGAKNADGDPITAEGKTVAVVLDTEVWELGEWGTGHWVEYTRSGSETVDLTEGAANITIELNGDIGREFGYGGEWIMNNIVVTIDDATVNL